MLGQKLILLAHDGGVGLIPWIEVDHALHTSLDHLLQTREAWPICRIESRSICPNSVPARAQKSVSLGVDADTDVKVLAFAPEQRVRHLRKAAFAYQLALPATLTAAVPTVRKTLRSTIESRADDSVGDHEYGDNCCTPAGGPRLNRLGNLHVIVIPLNLLDTRQIARRVRDRDILAWVRRFDYVGHSVLSTQHKPRPPGANDPAQGRGHGDIVRNFNAPRGHFGWNSSIRRASELLQYHKMMLSGLRKLKDALLRASHPLIQPV